MQGDPKLAEYSEPTPLYADPRPAAMPAAPFAEALVRANLPELCQKKDAAA